MQVTIDKFKVGNKIIVENKKFLIKSIVNDIYEIEDITNNNDVDNDNSIKLLKLNKNELFDLLTLEQRKIFTHNCQERLVCGQLGSIASRMALGDNQATTIDGTHKGAGMVSSQGIVSNIQYYFEEQKWIEEWYAKRGLTKKGYEPHEEPDAEIDPSTIDLGEDETISIDQNKTVIEFNDIRKEVDHTKDQKFEEI